MHKVLLLIISSLFLLSCNQHKHNNALQQEDKEAESMLQGIWVDGMSEAPLFRIDKDSIYYVDSLSAPVLFKIIEGKLYTYGAVTNTYKIDTLTRNNFIFESVSGDVIHLIKSTNANDINEFTTNRVIPIYDHVVKKDTVIMYDNNRYRGYVYINPSKIKVKCPTITDEGMSVDNVYYDNIIHICVYEGKKDLYSKDIKKDMFKGVVPNDFLDTSVLVDMNFINVNASGYKYQAVVENPYRAMSYVVDINISKDRKVTYNLSN